AADLVVARECAVPEAGRPDHQAEFEASIVLVPGHARQRVDRSVALQRHGPVEVDDRCVCGLISPARPVHPADADQLLAAILFADSERELSVGGAGYAQVLVHRSRALGDAAHPEVDRVDTLDAVAGLGEVAVAVVIDVERRAVLHQPNAGVGVRAEDEQTITWGTSVSALFADLAFDVLEFRGRRGCAGCRDDNSAEDESREHGWSSLRVPGRARFRLSEQAALSAI